MNVDSDSTLAETDASHRRQRKEKLAKWIHCVIDAFVVFRDRHADAWELPDCKKIYIDSFRLYRALSSAYDDREFFCREFPEICSHKEASFVAKWFMNFRPVIIPEKVLHDIENKCNVYQNSQVGKSRFAFFLNMNEEFILRFIFVYIMDLPAEFYRYLYPKELSVLLQTLSYRMGRMQGEDFSLTLYFTELTLKNRFDYTAASASFYRNYLDSLMLTPSRKDETVAATERIFKSLMNIIGSKPASA